jgi:hypothetical protein
VVAVEHAGLFGVKPERFAFAVERGDAGIERAVEIERVAVAGEQRRDLALDGLSLPLLSTKNTLETRSSARPLRSSATMVLSKLGAAGSAAMVSISARWAASARSKAGRKCSGRIASNGGRPKAPVQLASSGFWRAWASVMRPI